MIFFLVFLSRNISFGFVRAAHFAFLYVLEFTTNHLTTHRRHSVGKHVAFKVVVFVLYDTSKETIISVSMFDKVFVEIINSD